MAYGFYKTNLLRKEYEQDNKIEYDVVIKCRPDVFFRTELPKRLLNIDSEELILCGNPCPVTEFVGEREYYHAFRALDIICFSGRAVADFAFDDQFAHTRGHIPAR